MSLVCSHCGGTGFLNDDQIPAHVLDRGPEGVLYWLKWFESPTDVTVCNCCGDGEQWYGEAGQHYGTDDPSGKSGPYTYNGGLCECH